MASRSKAGQVVRSVEAHTLTWVSFPLPAEWCGPLTGLVQPAQASKRRTDRSAELPPGGCGGKAEKLELRRLQQLLLPNRCAPNW